MSDWDEIRNAWMNLCGSGIDKSANPPQYLCHPFQYYESIRLGILKDDGTCNKGYSVYDVWAIPIPPLNKEQ